MRALTIQGHQDTAMGVLERAARSGELENKSAEVLKDCLRITLSWTIAPSNQLTISPLQEQLRFLIESKEGGQAQQMAIAISEKALVVSEASLSVSKKSYRLDWWIFWVAIAALVATVLFGILSLRR